MKPFLGMNLTTDKNNEQMNGNEFLVQTPSSSLSNYLETSIDKADQTIEKSKLPLPFRVIQYICGIAVLVIAGGILKADVSFAEGYQNAPGLYWTAGICGVVWAILWFSGYCRSKAVFETEETAMAFSHVERISDEIYRELGVPADAKVVDILSFYYKVKDGNLKVCEKGVQLAKYFNLGFKVFTDSENMYLVNLEGKYAFPLSSVVKIHTMKKKIRIAAWTKEEEYNQGIYKQYNLKKDNYGCIHCKSYHILEISHDGENWGIYVPCYEAPVFEAIVKKS